MCDKKIEVKGLVIGEGQPKICIPLTAHNDEELLQQALAAEKLGGDLYEWRMDWFDDLSGLAAAGKALRAALPDAPLLFTFRTAAEGGQKPVAQADYLSICRETVRSGNCDMIDLEFFTADEELEQLTKFAHENSVLVIASSHDFEKTPPKADLFARMHGMAAAGADIAKVAVMPQCPEDVLELLALTLQARRSLNCPVVTMAMGSLGAVSRICGEAFGSAITFGAGEQGSAPGQIPAQKLRQILEALHL